MDVSFYSVTEGRKNQFPPPIAHINDDMVAQKTDRKRADTLIRISKTVLIDLGWSCVLLPGENGSNHIVQGRLDDLGTSVGS